MTDEEFQAWCTEHNKVFLEAMNRGALANPAPPAITLPYETSPRRAS